MAICDYPVCDQEAITPLDVNGEEKHSCEEHIQHFTDQVNSQEESNVEARIKSNPLSITIFENDQGFYTAKLQRAFTRDDGETFEHTDSCRKQDLRKASRLYEKAADYLEQVEVETQ